MIFSLHKVDKGFARKKETSYKLFFHFIFVHKLINAVAAVVVVVAEEEAVVVVATKMASS